MPAETTDASALALQRFTELLSGASADDGDTALIRLVLSRYRGAEPDLQRIDIRPLLLRGAAHWSFVYRYARRDVTRNLPAAEALATVQQLLAGQDFGHALLNTRTADAQLETHARGKRFLNVKQVGARAAPARAHDRAKQRHVDPQAPFLAELGVIDTRCRLVPTMARKWKQIDKFIEILDHAYGASPLASARAEGDTVRLVDYGAGKGYLTFAAEHWLRKTRRLRPQVVGVEQRADMVTLCNDVAQRLGLDRGLRFELGDIATRPAAPVDIMVALHACDTATDDAIHAGIRDGASIIVCSPCCHKQLRPQLLSPAPLGPVLRHGIHLGQQAEMVTDSLRALLLEAAGYDTQVFEFISLEHTNKNKMILGVKHGRPLSSAALRAQIDDIKAYYGIREHRLDRLMTAGVSEG